MTSTSTHVLPRVAAKKRAVIHYAANVAVPTAIRTRAVRGDSMLDYSIHLSEKGA
jgi:hypothetical protein